MQLIDAEEKFEALKLEATALETELDAQVQVNALLKAKLEHLESQASRDSLPDIGALAQKLRLEHTSKIAELEHQLKELTETNASLENLVESSNNEIFKEQTVTDKLSQEIKTLLMRE